MRSSLNHDQAVSTPSGQVLISGFRELISTFLKIDKLAQLNALAFGETVGDSPSFYSPGRQAATWREIRHDRRLGGPTLGILKLIKEKIADLPTH
jgi:hypothetical protein